MKNKILTIGLVLILGLGLIGCSDDEDFSYYEISTDIEGEGSIVLDPQKDEYKDGDIVDIEAIADEGWSFKEWGGSLSVDKNPNEIVVDSDMTIRAEFKKKAVEINLEINGEGNIDFDEKEYNVGDEITLTAEPEKGWQFKEWVGDVDDTDKTIEIEVRENMNITANFEIKTDKLDINVNGEGSYNLNPSEDEYDYGDEVNIKAIPDYGWKFESWSGDIESRDNPVDVIIKDGEVKVLTNTEDSLNVTANFIRDYFSVTTNVEGEGEINSDLDNENYKYEDTIEIKAIPDEGYHLAEWKGIDKKADEEVEITVVEDMNITALFEINTYNVVFKNYDGSTIEEQTIKHGDSAEAPDNHEREGYTFEGWDNNFDNVKEDLIVNAEFEKKEYTVNVGANETGKVTPVIDNKVYKYGDIIEITATSNKGYYLASWDGINKDDDENIKVQVTDDLNITALFEKAIIGSGTEEEPFMIYTFEGLEKVGDESAGYPLDAYYKLESNIDASRTQNENYNKDRGWNPIGGDGKSFRGVFNGAGYKIDGINIKTGYNSEIGYVGLFGIIENGQIKDLDITNIDIEDSSNKHVGGLVGQIYHNSIVENIYVSGKFNNSAGYIGGITGINYGTIKNSNVEANIDNGWNYVGGIAGSNNSRGIIEKSYFKGKIAGTRHGAGGLVGENSNEVIKSYVEVEVKGYQNVGGLIGLNSGMIDNCYSINEVTGEKNIGGVVGKNFESGIIKQTFSSGIIKGESNAWGLVGVNDYGTIERSYWDIETSKKNWSDGGEGKTTEEMQQQTTYEDWDFDKIWDINEENSYPYLKWE